MLSLSSFFLINLMLDTEMHEKNLTSPTEICKTVDENSIREVILNDSWDTQMRLGFIRKTYGILLFQIAVTFSMCVVSIVSPSFSKFQIDSPGYFWLALIGTLILSICIFCFRSLARKVPTNYILLVSFTLCEAYLVSAICGMTNPRIVIMAAAMTCGVVSALTIYACTTKTDFTIFGSMMFVISFVMILFGIFAIFSQNKLLHIIFSSLGVIAFSIYLVYDTQLIVGNQENKLEIDDYIIGAMMLYIDIINLFLHILSLLKAADN